jgi:hypothetical protein
MGEQDGDDPQNREQNQGEATGMGLQQAPVPEQTRDDRPGQDGTFLANPHYQSGVCPMQPGSLSNQENA